jgi:hypothetical protein
MRRKAAGIREYPKSGEKERESSFGVVTSSSGLNRGRRCQSSMSAFFGYFTAELGESIGQGEFFKSKTTDWQ